MDSRIFDKKDVILLKVNEDDLMSFLVDTDINDVGDYDWRLPDLTEAIINTIPEYVFADYKGSQTSLVEMVARLREAAKSIYKIPEYRLMRDFCLNNDQQAAKKLKESGYMNRGEFGELLLHLLLREFKGTIPLVSKVYFKDSSGVPAHGFDAVHITPDDGILWLGESKLYTDAKPGLNALIGDLTEHFKKEYLNEQFVIIKKNLENNSIPGRDEWIRKLNSASKLSDQLKMINIPMLCVYNDEIYDRFIDVGASQAFEYHEKSVRGLKKYFDDHNQHPLKSKLNVILLLFSIKDKKAFITMLHEKLWHMQNI